MLNAEQQAAVDAPLGYNLVIASAGTGKTSTIVARIEKLLMQGVQPEDILLLTFTNKAAAEMIKRVERKFPKEAKKIEAGTFHAVSYRWLKNIDSNLVLKPPKELKTLFKSIYEKRDFQRLELKPYAASSLYEYYSYYQNSSLDMSFGEWIERKNPEHAPLAPIYEDIVQEYEELKASYGFLSFNDLLLEVIRRKEDIKSFVEVLVDEYQDTNNLQASFLDAIRFDSLFCVGDYDQSIYAFNGANIDIIASFTKRYPKAKVFNLSKNYRSTKYILDLANRVIANNERIYPKRLEVMNLKKAHPPKLLAFEDLYAQYEAIAARISVSLTSKEEIAVIFRNNASADGIEAALRQRGITCKRKGSRSLFDMKEIQALFDLLAILINPKDLLAFIHILQYAKGVGSNIAKDLYEALQRCGEGDIKKGLLSPIDIANPFSKPERNYQLALFDDFVQLGSKSRFKDLTILDNPILKHPKLSQEGAKFLDELAKLFRLRLKRPESFIQHIRDSAIFEAIIHSLAANRAKRKDGSIDEALFEEAKQKIARRVALMEHLARNYEDVYRFYNAMVLGSSEMEQGSGVNLLSIHASKGLEFREVYVVDLMEGRFPNLKLAAKSGSIEEERRLFYVAVTRAKEILYLSYAKYDRIKRVEFLPSRFLKEAGLL